MDRFYEFQQATVAIYEKLFMRLNINYAREDVVQLLFKRNMSEDAQNDPFAAFRLGIGIGLVHGLLDLGEMLLHRLHDEELKKEFEKLRQEMDKIVIKEENQETVTTE